MHSTIFHIPISSLFFVYSHTNSCLIATKYVRFTVTQFRISMPTNNINLIAQVCKTMSQFHMAGCHFVSRRQNVSYVQRKSPRETWRAWHIQICLLFFFLFGLSFFLSLFHCSCDLIRLRCLTMRGKKFQLCTVSEAITFFGCVRKSYCRGYSPIHKLHTHNISAWKDWIDTLYFIS